MTDPNDPWIPAFAGMTEKAGMTDVPLRATYEL